MWVLHHPEKHETPPKNQHVWTPKSRWFNSKNTPQPGRCAKEVAEFHIKDWKNDMPENKLEQCLFFNPMGLMLQLLYSVKKNVTVLGPCHILVSLAKGVVRVYTQQTNTGLPAKKMRIFDSSSRILVLGLSFHKLSDSRPSLLIISISHLKPASKGICFFIFNKKVSKKPGLF